MGKYDIISIDLGTGNGKGYIDTVPPKKVTKVINAFGIVTERLLSDGKDIPLTFDWTSGEDEPFSSDEFALRFGGGASTTQNRECLTSKNAERMVFSILAKMGIESGKTYAPIFCIPIQEFREREIPGDKNSPRKYVQFLKEQWRGEHAFKLAGKPEIHFSFSEPMVTMQAVAALFHFAHNTNGKEVFHIRRDDVFAVDTGKRDMNYAWIERGANTLDNYTDTVDGASWSACVAEVKAWLEGEHGAMFSDLEVEQACILKKPMIYWKQWIDLKPMLDKAVERQARRQIDAISRFPLSKCHHLLLCGAPSPHFLPYYQKLLDPRFQLISPYYDVATVLGGHVMRSQKA